VLASSGHSMSNEALQTAVAGLFLAQLAALIWALVPRGRMWGVLVVNLLLSAGVLVYAVPLLPQEIAYLASASTTEWLDYNGIGLCLIELAVLVSAALAIGRLRVPLALIWLGFAVNFVFTLFAVIFAFTFEFRCCGYL
jgi:hypothetical protein